MRPIGSILALLLLMPAAIAFAQAPEWRIADHLNDPAQWTIYNRDERGGAAGLPVTGGDFNGDGLDDAVLAPTEMLSAVANVPSVWMVLSDGQGGEFDLLTIDPNSPPANVVRILWEPGGFSGEVTSGDYNGDGLADLVIGSQTSNAARGAVFIIWGNAALGGQVIQLGDNPPSPIMTTEVQGTTPEERVGLWVTTADVNNDGIDDVLFTADQSSVTAPHAGSAYVLYGTNGSGMGHLAGTPGTNKAFALDAIPSMSALTTVFGIDAEDHFGSAMRAFDLNNNGFPDLIISAALNRSGAAFGGISPHAAGGADGPTEMRAQCGETYIIWDNNYIPSLGVTIDLRNAPPADLTTVFGKYANGYAGEEIWASDLDGDGNLDLIIGAITANGARGGAHIIYNDLNLVDKNIDLLAVNELTGEVTTGGATIRTVEFLGINPGDILGDTLRAADINLDGFGDIFLGVPANTNSHVYVFFGNGTRMTPYIDFASDPLAMSPMLTPFHPIIIRELSANDVLCYSMNIGDYNGDGFPDVIMNGMRGDAKNGPPPNQPGNAYFISGRALSEAAGAPLSENAAEQWTSYE